MTEEAAGYPPAAAVTEEAAGDPPAAAVAEEAAGDPPAAAVTEEAAGDPPAAAVAEEAAEEPVGFQVGDCVKVGGLTSEAGKLLNDEICIITKFIEDSGRFEVRFVPEKFQNMKPENITKLDEKARLQSLIHSLLGIAVACQEHLENFRKESANKGEFEGKLGFIFGQVYERHAVDPGWQYAMLGKYNDEEINNEFGVFNKLIEYGNLGPLDLDKGACVEVFGLQSDSGKLMNGQKGRAMKFDAEKERYEVRFVPEKVMNIKPDNLKPLDDKEKCRALLRDLLEVYAGKRVVKQIAVFQEQAVTKSNYGQSMMKLKALVAPPVFERYGVEEWWLQWKQGEFWEDEEITKMSGQFGSYMEMPKLGPLEKIKGEFLEIHGLESEAGKKMNGSPVAVKGWNAEKGRYDLYTPGDISDVKAIKPENLKPIEEKHLTHEEAIEFQRDLTEQYKTADNQEIIAKLKEAHPSVGSFMASIKPVAMEMQKPVLAKYGFRTDYVGQAHFMAALGVWEQVDPSFAARNFEMEKWLGLPDRSVAH